MAVSIRAPIGSSRHMHGVSRSFVPHSLLDVFEEKLLWSNNGSGPTNADVRDALQSREMKMLHEIARNERPCTAESSFAVDCNCRSWAFSF